MNIATLQDDFRRLKSEESEESQQSYADVVARLADDEDVDSAEIAAVLGTDPLAGPPVCPITAWHSPVKHEGPLEDGRHRYRCRECGRSFDADAGPNRDAEGKTVADLERDVALAKERREWEKVAARRPALVQQKRKIVEKQKEQVAAVDALRKQQRETNAEFERVNGQLRACDRAAERLRG